MFVLLLLAGLVSACGLGTGYQRSGGSYVYTTWDESQGRVAHPIIGIEAASFQILHAHGYAKDRLSVYYHWNPVQDADPNSFVALTDLYGKDDAHVYYQDQTIPGADPASFAFIDIRWSKDAQDVYLQGQPLEACDPTTFVLLPESWQRDSQCVYREGKKLPNADAASFVVLNYWFGKDQAHVYSFLAKPIEGADAATFKLREGVCQVCAEDKNRCYRYEEPVACASLK